MKIFIPGEENPLVLRGFVKWMYFYRGIVYRYRIGIEFDVFGSKKGLNPVYGLDKLRDLEKQHLTNEYERTPSCGFRDSG